MKISFTLNGAPAAVDVAPERRLIDILRIDLGLIGTREGCGEGSCGSCLVLMDENLVNACLVPAFRIVEAQIVTIEGLARRKVFEDLQAGLEEARAFRCGFCSSGVVMAAADLLAHNPEPRAEDVRQALSGNICRCGNYRAIVEGILAAVRMPRKKRYVRRR